VFNVPQFAQASQDRFFLCIEAADPKFDRQATGAFLVSLGPKGEIIEVPWVEEIEKKEEVPTHTPQ
jgi:hypothetical protein